MEITPRDVFTLVGYGITAAATWLAMDRRVTRLEERLRRAEALEARVDALTAAQGGTHTTVEVLAERVGGLSGRVGVLEDEVKAGFSQVLTGLGDLKASWGAARRTGDS